MKLILKMIEQIVDALAQILAPQKPVVTGNYLARRDAMRRWQHHWHEGRYRSARWFERKNECSLHGPRQK